MGFEERQERRKKSVVAQIAGVSEKESSEQTVIKLKPKQETRSKKFPVSVKPSLHHAAQKKATDTGYSLNEVVNQLLEKWVESQ